MAVLNGKPTVMGGYEKGATPRDHDRVTFGIKGSESKMGQGILSEHCSGSGSFGAIS